VARVINKIFLIKAKLLVLCGIKALFTFIAALRDIFSLYAAREPYFCKNAALKYILV